MTNKSTNDEIRQRFDADVERFSDLQAAQKTAMDSALALQLIADGAAAVCPNAKSLLDIGCGAGNWSLTLLQKFPSLDVTMIDLSRPMLDRAQQRVTAAGATGVRCIQADVREAKFDAESFDLIVAGSVLHHLRGDDDWRSVFASFHRWLRPGGSVWVYDLVSHESPAVEQTMNGRYRAYLDDLGGPAFTEKVMAYIDAEDSPRPVTWQLDRLREAGFSQVDILHKTATFAAYVAVKTM